MNKNIFRIIFNKRRGQLMAVAETSSSQGKGSRGEAVTSGHPAISDFSTVAISALSFAVLCALGAVLWALPTPKAHAQVVAYRNAPGNQQPTILQTANGVPQINIQTPSAAGVSHNVYSQFDVQSNGAILNNSRINVQTQQGGWVQGNPWLAMGSARVILNEVNSSNPSYLNGYVEVGGQKAEVVIANPSGISVNGGGFINTSKATLTTGTPIVNGGSLDGYRVQGGNISINGNGLDLSTTDYAAILARAVQVNASIWANEFMVVTGANQIDATSLGANTMPVTTAIASAGQAPSFALDVAQIGGMYAGKIHLIGTEQGLGVRSVGTLSATGGDLVLQNNGWLTTTGALQAGANLQITTQGNITNSGTLYASNDQTLSATDSITNSGVIAAQGNTRITAHSLSSTSASVVGAGIKTDGTLANSGNLNIATAQALVANGQNLAAGNTTLTGSSVDLSGSQTGAANMAITANSGNFSSANATVATSGTTGVLAIIAKTNNDQTLDNTHGVLSAGQLNLDVANLTNAQGQITQTGVGDTSIVLTSPTSTFNNTGGTVAVNSTNLNLSADTLTNTDGKIQHAGTGTLKVIADTLSSVRGQVASNSNVELLIGTQLNNTDGVISAAKDLNLLAGFSIAQPSQRTELNNTRGLIQATAGSLNLNVGNLENIQGSVYAHHDLSLISTGAIVNTGFIAAQGNTTLSANRLSSGSTSVLGAGIKADGTLANSGDLKITTTQTLSANGQNLAAGNATFSGTGVNLSGSQTGGANIDITATLGDVNTSNATVAAAGTLNIAAKVNNSQTLNNTQGVLSARQLNVDVANFNNTHGQALQTGTGDMSIVLTSPTGKLNNTNGTIATNSANLNLSADVVTNIDGKIQHAGTDTLSITANSLANLRGQIVGNQNTTLQLASLDNTQGSVYASKDLSVTATGAITNTGFIAAQGNTSIMASSLSSDTGSVLGAGVKTDGTLATSGNLSIVTTQTLSANGQNLAAGNMTISGSDNNLSGSQTGAANIDITATSGDVNTSGATVATSGTIGLLHIVAQVNPNNAQTLNNKQGVLSAGQINLEVSKLDNTQAIIVAGHGDLSVVTHAFDNTDGKLQSAGSGNLSVAADAVTNLRGQVFSKQTATLQLSSLDNSQGSVYAAQNLTMGATDAVTNTGVIAAQGNTTLSANRLSSGSTSVLGAGIKADGTLANSGDLKITTTQTLSANGQNLAAGSAVFSGTGVNLSGSQTGGANIDITATLGDVNTSNATVAAAGTLNIAAKVNNSQTLNNTQGVLSARQLNVDVANFNNTQGQALQTGTGDMSIVLTSPTGKLNNTNGTIATNSANLNLSADVLTNIDGKIQHAGSGTLHITANTLSDQRGKIVSNNALVIDAGAVDHRAASTAAKSITLTASSLNNTGGDMVQTGNGVMAVSVTQGLDNTAGTLAGNGNLTVAAQSLTNNQGQVSALGDLTANLNTTTGVLSNLQGLVAAKGNVTVTAASVDNTLGTLASVDKNLSVTTTGATTNDSGKIQAALDITLSNAGLSNTRTSNALATSTTPYGSIIGRKVDINTDTQTLNNAGGTIAASQTANLQTGVLNNNGGLIQAGTNLAIDTHGQTLTNTHAANYTSSNNALNGKGGIAAQGTTTLTTGDLSNDAGYIGSKGALTTSSANISNTQSGQIQGLGNLTLTAGTINNTGGVILSEATTSLSAGTVTNSNTSSTGLGIEGLDVSVSTTTLRNDSGAIRADGQLTITSAGTVNNNAGLLSSANALTLQDTQAQANRTLAITNTNGTLLAGQSLVVAANSIGGDSNILSKGSLSLSLNTNFANSGQLIANGNATITTSGNVSNSGKLQAGNTLNLTANNIDNTATGEISANTTQVNASSTLTNRGLLDGVDTQINAGTVNNIGTGRIYGDRLSMAAVNFINDTETLAGVTKAATIAARDRLDLGISGTLTNREHALIYSVGDTTIGGALNATRRATGLATTVNNNSATIEAGGNLSLSATALHNKNMHLTTALEVKSTSSVVEYQGSGAANRYAPGDTDVYTFTDESLHLHTPEGIYESWTQYDVTRTISETTVKTSDPSKILAGGRISLYGNSVLNDNSQIIAGGALNASVVNLNNTQVIGEHVVHDSGTATSYWRNRQKGTDSTGSSSAAYDPADVITDLDLKVMRYQQFTLPVGTGTQVASLANRSVTEVLGNAGTANARSQSVSSSQISVTQTNAPQTNAANGASASSSVSAISNSAVTADSISSASNTNIQKPSAASGANTPSSTFAGQAKTQTLSVRGAHPNTTLPINSLYKNNPSLTSAYLVETDTRFTNNKTWLGSDFMTQTLSLDPTVTQKRLGDGFYEQKLIREQVAELTGRRFLADFRDDEQEYKALMTNAITFGQQYNLRPGIALSAQQVAQLTSDIVWLVEQTVTLPDGSTQKVLVPQLYVKVQPGDLDGSGALLAGNDVNLDLSGDLTNSGTIAGRNVMSLTADNVNNLGGRLQGEDMQLSALQDLNNVGGTISATRSLAATAGRDLNVQTTTQSASNAQSTRTGIDRVAGLYVSGANGTLVASAGRDLNLAAAVVSNAGTGATTLSAVNNLNLSTVKIEQSNNIVGISNRRTSNQVTTIQSGGNLTIEATNNVNLEGGNLDAQGDFKLTSTQGGVNLIAVADAVSSSGPNRQNQTQNINGVQIKARGNALVQASQGDIQAQSLQLQAGQKATLTADAGKVDLTSAQAYNKTQAGTDVRQSLLTERTQIVSGTGVEVYGQESVNIMSADITATNSQAKVTSAGDVTLGYNTDTEQRNWTSTSSSSSWGGLKKKTTTTQHETLDKTAQITQIHGDQVVVLGNNVKSEGAKLDGAQLVQVEGVNNTQLYAVQDLKQTTQNSQTSSRFAGITYIKSSSTDTTLKSEALGTQLSSDKAIQIGVGVVTDVQGAILTAPKVDFVGSAGADTSKAGELILGGSSNITQTIHTEKTTTAGVWQAQSGQGETQQTLNQTQLNGNVNMASGINTSVVIPEGNLKAQVQTLSQQPGMSYLNELSKDPKVNWGQVKLAHDKWDYKQEGLTPAGAILLAIAVSAATGGMGAELAGTASTVTTAGVTTTTTTMAGTTLATTVGATTTYTAAGAALNAGFSALTAQASVSLANNGGDIGKTLKDLGSSNTVKNTLVAMTTAGVGTSVAGQGVSAIAAQTVAGCVAGAATSSGCEQGAKTAAVLSTAGEAYQSLVGYAANAGPGENRHGEDQNTQTYKPNEFGRQKNVDQGMNIIGLNDPNKASSIGAQGGSLSRALNQLPFINATAGLHDYMFNANPSLESNFTFWNVPTMVPAAALSIPAALNDANISWITQVKRPDSMKPPTTQSLIRIDPRAIAGISGEKK